MLKQNQLKNVEYLYQVCTTSGICTLVLTSLSMCTPEILPNTAMKSSLEQSLCFEWSQTYCSASWVIIILSFLAACYGIVKVPSGPWFCCKCRSTERVARVVCIMLLYICV